MLKMKVLLVVGCIFVVTAGASAFAMSHEAETSSAAHSHSDHNTHGAHDASEKAVHGHGMHTAADTGMEHNMAAPSQGGAAMHDDASDHMEHGAHAGHEGAGQLAAEEQHAHEHDAAHAEHAADHSDTEGHVHRAPPADQKLAGVDEKLGDVVPEGMMFRDEQGNSVDIRSLMDRPTLIVPVYYSCPTVCNLLMSSVAKVLPQVSMDPNQEYRVLSVSFDEYDTPAVALRRQAQYIAATEDTFPAESWSFLSADQQTIDAFLDSIGYRVTRIDKDFVHPVALVVLAPGGKVVRYLYGNRFLPFDVTMALTEAEKGKVGLSLKRVVAFCFSYDPEGKTYVFNVMRVAGASVLSGAAILFFVLTRGGRRRRRHDDPQ